MSNDKRSDRVKLVMRFLHQSPNTPHTVTEIAEALELNVMSTRYTMRRDFPECFTVDEVSSMGRCVYSLSGEWPNEREFDIEEPLEVIVVTRERKILGALPVEIEEEPVILESVSGSDYAELPEENPYHAPEIQMVSSKEAFLSDEEIAEKIRAGIEAEVVNLKAELAKDLVKAKELPVEVEKPKGDRMQGEDEKVKYTTGKEPRGWVYNREAVNFLDRIFMMARNMTYVEICRNLTEEEARKLNVVGKTINYSTNKLINSKIIGTPAQKDWSII